MKDYLNKQKKKIFLLKICLIITIFMILVTVSYGWLVYKNQLSTISVIQIPSKISITGGNRSEMLRIPLELTEDDTLQDNVVTIKRIFCIESTGDYFLELAHTTNIAGMSIDIYPVTVEHSNMTTETEKSVKWSDADVTYYYEPDDAAIDGDYLNLKSDELGIANDSLHNQIYNEDENETYGVNVQKNAEPLYWLSSPVKCDEENYFRTDTDVDGRTTIYYRYFVLKISWNTTDSENDMIYLMASHTE